MGGLPCVIHVDNGKEFHSDALLRGCQEYGITLEHRTPGQPHLGGHIERLIGTMMGAVHLLSGTTQSNPQEKGSYDSEGRAALTLPELERWLALEIAGVYHLSIHSALGNAVPRIIQRDGIHFHGIRYWDNVLSPWAGRLNKPLWIKYDPRNLARVYVRDPQGKHWPVPYADLR